MAYDPIGLYRRNRLPLSLQPGDELSKRWLVLRAVRIILIASALFIAAVGFAASGAAASRSTTGATSAYSVKRVADPQSSLEYWTHRRMAAAEPMTMRSVGAEEIADLGEEPEAGEPYLVEASAPVTAQAVCTPGSGITELREPLPFQRFEIPDTAAEPCRTHGMIFGRAFGQRYSCSGTVVNSDNRSMVWTAGHCVHGLDAQGQGEFFEDLIFVPGYENGVEPFGSWAAQELLAPTRWRNREDLRYDFAAIVLAPNTSGLIADVVGSRGIAFNQQPNESFQSFGYPALPNPPFDGELLQSCTSGGSGRILDGVIAMGCDMQEGSSGGGWLIRDEYVSSIQSFGAPILFPRVAFGPYLGDAAKTLYDFARDGTTVFPQPTPTVTPDPVPTKHTMKLTLRLRRHLVARGRLTAASGHVGCTQVAPLDIYRLTTRGSQPIGKIRYTDADGRFRVKLRDRLGRYFVYSPPGTYDLSNKCTDAISVLRRHRH